MNAINNFINVGKLDSNGENVPVEENLPIYGVLWFDGSILVVYEVNDYNNPYDEYDDMITYGSNITVQQVNDIVSKPIFIGVDENQNGIFIDESKNITITNPNLSIINLADDLSTTSIKDDELTHDDILNELNIDKGFIFGYFSDYSTDDSMRATFSFIANRSIEEGASGFGSVNIIEL